MDSDTLQAGIAAVVFIVMLTAFGIISAILNGHWKRYELNDAFRNKVKKIYLSVGGVILLLMLITLIATI